MGREDEHDEQQPEEEEEYDADVGRAKRRRKEVALFADSGMTEEERRGLRREQRSLHHEVEQEVGREEDEDGIEFLSRSRQRNNKLFKNVAYTREAALDADNSHLIASKTLQQVDRLVQVPRFDAVKLANKLHSKLSVGTGSSRYFDWKHLGKECGGCFNAIPSGVSFLAGTMEQEETVVKKTRKPRAKRYDVSQLEEQRPEVVENAAANKGNADNLSAAEKAMKTMKKKLKKLSHRREGEDTEREVDGVKFLFNPNSFTQTVENIFHYSFMVKMGEGGIGVRPEKKARTQGKRSGLVVKQIEKEDDENEVDERTQAVIAFTMRDWRRIVEAQQLEEGLLPHRTGSKQQGRSQQTQQSQLSQGST